MSVIRLALIGLGNQGREHLSAHQGCDLSRIVVAQDLDGRARKRCRADFPDVAVVESVADLEGHKLDGIVMALPHHCYESVWPEVLKMKLPVLKEKPLGRSFAEATRFLRDARRMGCPVQTAIQRRSHPTYRELQHRIGKCPEIHEVRAQLHLGFDPAASSTSWRNDRRMAGGGALLDSGYHLVDLVHFLIGRFELLSSGLWDSHGRLLDSTSNEVEVEARLYGRQGSTMIAIESLVAGRPDGHGGFNKFECVEVRAGKKLYQADREVLRENGEVVKRCGRDWENAMVAQLDRFGKNIQSGKWDDQDLWDQLPAMKLLEQAYQRSFCAS